jgi:hypothetical protein
MNPATHSCLMHINSTFDLLQTISRKKRTTSTTFIQVLRTSFLDSTHLRKSTQTFVEVS